MNGGGDHSVIAELKKGPLAQLVEQETLNLLVVGSIPTRPTNSELALPRVSLLLVDRLQRRARPAQACSASDSAIRCVRRICRLSYQRQREMENRPSFS
jgi:hypothetical protein